MVRNQKGFGAVEVVVVLVIIGIIGFGGWFVWRAAHQADKPTGDKSSSENRSSNEENDEPGAPWHAYRNEEGKFTFQYPDNWIAHVDEALYDDAGRFDGVSGKLTSPAGNELVWVYMAAGGKGGDCKPDTGDTPFAPGNNCSSKEVISVEKLPPVKAPEGLSFPSLFRDALYITKSRYADSAGRQSYQLCLDSYYNEDAPQVGTRMGLVFPCDTWVSGLNMTFEVKDKAGFNSADAKTAHQIMRSFNSL